jgi:hypothetical protein
MVEHKVEFKLEEVVLHVRVSGQFPHEKLEQLGNAFQRFIDACSVHRRNKILLESRESQTRFSTIQYFRAGKDAVHLTAASIGLAILTRKDLRDPFFEDVVANRGGRIGGFRDMDSARNWL